MKYKRLKVIMVLPIILVLVPLIARQFTAEVNWSPADFLVMGILLFGTGLLCEAVMRKVKKTGYRVTICGIILGLLILVWLELAVGIFGTSFAGS